MIVTFYAEQIKKLPSWLYKIGAQYYYDKRFPRHLFLETTTRCQLRCSYCPRPERTEDMDFGLFREIVDEAKEFGPRSFSLHLFGEPLLYTRIVDAVAYIKHCNRRNAILLTTNGVDASRFDRELYDQVDSVIFTQKEISERSEAALKMLGRKVKVRILKETGETTSWKNAEVRSIHNYGGSVDTSRWNVPNVKNRWPCYHLWFAPAVASNGDILLCCADPSRSTKVGSFPSMSIEEAWRKTEKFRIEQKNGIYSGICGRCDTWKTYPSFF